MNVRSALSAVFAASVLVLGACDSGSTPILPGACLPTALVSNPASNNSQNGNMFDVVALNGVVINTLTANLPSTATNVTVEIYHRAGSHVGHTTTAADWTLAGSATVSGSATGPVEVPIALDISMLAGDTHAFYVTVTSTTTYLRYTDGTAVGAVATQDANIQLLEGTGNAYPFGNVFSPRIYIGTINYTVCQ